jgi:hypothetical protein
VTRPRGSGEDPITAFRELLAGDDDGHARTTFMRGLTLGALLGAAIAGSLLVRRHPGRDRSSPEPRAGLPRRPG